MKVYYKEKCYNIDFPNDVKYFKLTRKYYPCLRLKIDEREVEIKDLKCSTEIRAEKFNYHHLVPRSRGGQGVESNLLRMDISRHNAYHLLFGNLTLSEVIELLQRIYHIKEAQRFRGYLK